MSEREGNDHSRDESATVSGVVGAPPPWFQDPDPERATAAREARPPTAVFSAAFAVWVIALALLLLR